MAELTTTGTEAEAPANSCCAPEQQATCCEPDAKADCCGPSNTSCACDAGASTASAGSAEQVRETVRERYAEAARAASTPGVTASSCCSDNSALLTDKQGEQVFGGALYEEQAGDAGTAAAIEASLGCGVPTAVADLHDGEVVLDLGSGAGADVLISARRVAPNGRAIGLDMTDEMLELARANAKEAGVENVEFVKGYLEDMPLADNSVDVIISNCVINLSADKPKTIAEAARVLRPGGRIAVSDVIADPDMDEQTKADMAAWTGCIAGALTESEFRSILEGAGLDDIEIQPTHKVHEFASAAIIRASKPATSTTTTRKIELYEPAMCCQTGVCGPSVDQQLIDVREDLRWVEAQGAQVARHNLSSNPDAFVANTKVTGLMAAFGDDALPALVIDGDIKMQGRYPSREELAGLLSGATATVAVPAMTTGGCGCADDSCC